MGNPRHAKRTDYRTAIWAGFLIGASLSACGYREWTYSADPPLERTPVSQKIVVIPPFVDERPISGKSGGLLIFVPFVPKSASELPRPESTLSQSTRRQPNGGWSRFLPTEDIAKALASEVHNKRLFRQTYYAFPDGEGDLVLKGTLTSTAYRHTIYLYGVTAFGAAALFMVGFPEAWIGNDLSFKLQLEDRRSHEVYFSKEYAGHHETDVYWMYNRAAGLWYDKILKDLMPRILYDLEETVKAKIGL